MLDEHQLKKTLSHLNGRGYKAYKQIQGRFEFPDFELFIDHVQGDPFAQPSKIRLRVQQDISQIPEGLWTNSVRQIALEDFVGRAVRDAIKEIATPQKGTGKSGLIFIDAGKQEVLERTAFVITKDWVEARIQIGLPARGRTILGQEAIEILCQEIPIIVEKSLKWKYLDKKACNLFFDCV